MGKSTTPLKRSLKMAKIQILIIAVLYDDEDCRGWSFEVPTGSYDLPEDLRNDAEVVVVRAGCKFTGYKKTGSRGKSSFCDALNSPSDMYCDIWDGYLRDNYASVECLCR